MRGGSDDTRAPGDAPNTVDAGWDALIGETEEDHGDSGQDAARPVTEDHAHDPDHETAPVGGRHGDADDEMARLMAGAAPKLPVVSTEPSTPIALDVPAVVEAPAPAPAPAPVKPKVVVRSELVSTKERRSSGSLRVVGAPVGVKPTAAPVRASRPTEPSEPPGPAMPNAASSSTGGLPWMWIGVGAIAIAAVAVAVTRDDPPSAHATAETTTKRASVEPPPAEVASTTDPVDETASDDADLGLAGAEDASALAERKPPKPRSADPREPPPDTPPEIAAVFRRLPVGPADRAPVGGIGASGIHIDHIAMGTETQGATCRGRADDFSVSAGDRAGVCVRVVHPRDKEELQVLWEKQGGSTRRSKMVVLPLHAYRTRGYLVLRNEYIGDWTVHILSADGVELARHDFTVVP